MDQDEDHLRLLSVFHYVVGGLTMFFALIPLIHVVIGASLLTDANFMEVKSEQTTSIPPDPSNPARSAEPSASSSSVALQSEVPSIVAWFFVVFGSTFVLIGEVLGVCLILAGRSIARRQRYLFVFVIGCVECIVFPFGTALGIFTIIVLSRPSVKARFATPAS